MIFFNSSGIMLQKPHEERESINGKYYRESVLAKVNRFIREFTEHWHSLDQTTDSLCWLRSTGFTRETTKHWNALYQTTESLSLLMSTIFTRVN